MSNDQTTTAGQSATAKRAPRVYIARPINGSGARLVRAHCRGAVREHLLAGMTIEPATHDDLIALLPSGTPVESADSPLSFAVSMAARKADQFTPKPLSMDDLI